MHTREKMRPWSRWVVNRIGDPKGTKAQAVKMQCENALLEAQNALETLENALKAIEFIEHEICYDDAANMTLETFNAHRKATADRRSNRLNDYVELFRLARAHCLGSTEKQKKSWNGGALTRALVSAFNDVRAIDLPAYEHVKALDAIFSDLMDPQNRWNNAEQYEWAIDDTSIRLETQRGVFQSIAEIKTKARAEQLSALNNSAGIFVDNRCRDAKRHITHLRSHAQKIRQARPA